LSIGFSLKATLIAADCERFARSIIAENYHVRLPGATCSSAMAQPVAAARCRPNGASHLGQLPRMGGKIRSNGPVPNVPSRQYGGGKIIPAGKDFRSGFALMRVALPKV